MVMVLHNYFQGNGPCSTQTAVLSYLEQHQLFCFWRVGDQVSLCCIPPLLDAEPLGAFPLLVFALCEENHSDGLCPERP